MFDDLRGLSDDEEMFEEPVENLFDVEEQGAPRGYFLGMTPGQRLFLSFLLLGTVIVIGLMCLMVTERVMVF